MGCHSFSIFDLQWLPNPSRTWVLPAKIELTVGQQYDLVPTLPLGIKPGGMFSTPAGIKLPLGVSLMPSGILIALALAEPTQVQFEYSEP